VARFIYLPEKRDYVNLDAVLRVSDTSDPEGRPCLYAVLAELTYDGPVGGDCFATRSAAIWLYGRDRAVLLSELRRATTNPGYIDPEP
jgi:hypothetical protein